MFHCVFLFLFAGQSHKVIKIEGTLPEERCVITLDRLESIPELAAMLRENANRDDNNEQTNTDNANTKPLPGIESPISISSDSE